MIGWDNYWPIDGDYFKIAKSRRSSIPLSYFLDKIDLNKYFIYKSTNSFRQVKQEDIGNYSQYIFFDKKLYCKQHIDKWIEEIKVLKITLMFLSKPFPRVEVIDKIEMI